MKRETGFYWVKDVNEWIVAEWRGAVWWLTSIDYSVKDIYFCEIDERRLEHG